MKARVKATGEIVDVLPYADEDGTVRFYANMENKWHEAYEIDIVSEGDTPDYWEKLKHQAAISAMSAFLIRGCNPEEIAQLSFELAGVMVNKLKEEKMQETNEGQALLYAVEKTAERTKREVIEKAVKWLKEEMCYRDQSSGRGRWGEIETLGTYDSLEEFIDEFKHAMEE